MRLLFMGSTGDHAGRSLVAWAFARALLQRGLRLGFLKPLFPRPDSEQQKHQDEDCELFREILCCKEPPESTCPVFQGKDSSGRLPTEEVARRLAHIMESSSWQTDLMLILGSRKIFLDDPASPISDLSLVQALKAEFVLVTRFLDLPRTVYSLLSVLSLLGSKIKAVVVNRIPSQQMQEVSQGIRARLSGREMPILFFVPDDPLISARTLAEVVKATGGEMLLGQHKAGELVAGWSMGAGHLLSGEMAIFKRFYNRILLLGPQDPHIEGTARPVGIILTAGRRPPSVALEAAQRMDLPLVLCFQDTFATLEKLEGAAPRLSAQSEARAERMGRWLAAGGRLEELWSSLGLAGGQAGQLSPKPGI